METTTTTTTKVTKHLFEGEWDGKTYDVLVDGELAGRVRRNDSTPNGYWGRWWVGNKYGTDTRKNAINYVVKRHLAKKENLSKTKVTCERCTARLTDRHEWWLKPAALNCDACLAVAVHEEGF